MLRTVIDRIAKRGFEGPFYAGVRGKARFLFESVVGRTELVFAATPQTFEKVEVSDTERLQLQTVSDFKELAPFRDALASEYYPGYLNRWRAPFTWGERAVLGTVDGRLASFAWIQCGTADGFPIYYGRLLQHEARILRVGVLPSSRRQGLSTLMLYSLLARLFTSGTKRVYIECHKYNLPSVRSFLRAGFRPIGAITVLEIPAIRGFVRWKPLRPIVAEFRKLGIELDVPAGN